MSSNKDNMFHHHKNYPKCSSNLKKLEILVNNWKTIKQSIKVGEENERQVTKYKARITEYNNFKWQLEESLVAMWRSSE